MIIKKTNPIILMKSLLKIKLKNYQLIFILFLLTLILFIIFYGNTMLFSDSSRELYIPMMMNKNAVLYKDIFNVYGPLGYQLNAFLIEVFGKSLRTFYIAGFLNSFLILIGLFHILKIFIKNHSILILSILFSITTVCIYSVSQTNYIFPYSYSMVYALNAFIWALVCLLYFLKNNKNLMIYMSFFLYGTSIAFKYEFIPFIFILTSVLIYKKINLKTVSLCILSLLIIPIISLSDLILRGATINDIIEALSYMKMLTKAQSVKVLYTYLGFIPSLTGIKTILLNFIIASSFYLLLGLSFLLSIKFIKNLSLKTNKIISVFSTILFLCIFCQITLTIIKNMTESNSFYFNWIGIFNLLLFIFMSIKLYKKHKNDCLSDIEISFYTLYCSTILCSYKCLFNISFNSYGTYYFPLLFICFILYFYIYKIKDKKSALTILTILIFLTGSLYCFSNVEKTRIVYHNFGPKYDTNFFKTEKEQIEPISNTINYIKSHTKKEDTILVLPEGSALNFLTDRKSHNKYYYLIPPNIEIFGEDNIVKDLEKNLPEYIIIQPLSYINFNETFFCESFGIKICNLIPKYYKKPIVFGNNFWIAIYERKDNDKE